TPEDTQLQLPASALLANDTDVDGPSLSITAVGNPTHGTVTLSGGIVRFTPAADYNGPASFEYTLSDGATPPLTATGLVSITVTPVNDPPVAGNDTATTAEDTPLVISTAALLANDTDVDGPSLSISAVGGAINGTVSLSGGTVTFTPNANFFGTASFTYTVTDGTAIATGVVTVTVTPVDDAPVAVDDVASVQADTSLVISHAVLLANDTDIDGPALSIVAVQNPSNGTVSLGATTITFTPSAGFIGAASFDYVVSDGTLTDVGTVAVTVTAGPVCGDGVAGAGEQCDDGNAIAGDGCSAGCQVEPGWACAGAPSACTTICGDGLKVGPEACDDGNADDTDGCTTQCVKGALCNATAIPGADRFVVDPATGHCYASFDGELTTFAAAQTACAASGGYLATITSAAEQVLVHAAQNPAENPWIGAGEDGNTTDAIFDWVTDEPFTYSNFAPGQPDNDIAFGGNGDCLHLVNAAGQWNDTNCNVATFVVGRICELEPEPCGDSVLQPALGEECEDGNAASGDGCSSICQLEDGCGDGNLDPGEQCDDDNTVSGDGCSSTCQIEDGCGDGNLDPGEECDDHNINGGDGCSATCQLEDGCGDGNLDPGEQCDDDNTVSGDGCSATCQRERLATFTFTGANGNEPTFAADNPLTAGLASKPVISRGSGLAASGAANTFSASGFTTGTTIDLTDYYTFTVTPAAGFTASVLSIELDERRSGTGPLSWAVRSNLDGFTTNLASFTVPNDTNTRHQTITLTPAFRNLAAPVEFRIYGFAAGAAAGTWRLDNIEIFGFTKLP
ncbi:MAG TPA: Ig-like domain-containing protein, partial [Kofleriaceae bacterium]|nr:Ig-like domain-containing protein [Kofleriaceae bacterium]